jgi:hypothetical protein
MPVLACFVMKINRSLVLFFLMVLCGAEAQAGIIRPRKKSISVAAIEARNETATPSFSRHVRDAQRITNLLADALLLTTAQRHAVARCTVAERQSLALAATEADALLAQYEYLAALRQVLAVSQLHAYNSLCQQLSGTVQPIDGTELAVR